MSKSPVVLWLVIILILTAGFFAVRIYFGPQIKQATTSQPVLGQTENLSFCDQDYLVQEVDIDGVDVTRRIAQLATDQVTEVICDDLRAQAGAGPLEVKVEQHNDTIFQGYQITIAGLSFKIDPRLNRIWSGSDTDGYYLGSLK